MEIDGPALAELGKDPRIASVRADRPSAPAALGSGTRVIGADRAHAAGVTGRGQNVVILDTGIDRDHPAFAGRIVAEACFSRASRDETTVRSLCPSGEDRQTGPGSADAETALCMDGKKNLCAHGSLVAGIAAGKKSAAGNADGVAPGAGIIAIQIYTRVDSEEHCGKGKAPCVLSWGTDHIFAMDYVIELAKTHRIAAVNLSMYRYGTTPNAYHVYDENEPCDVEPVSDEIGELSKLGIPTVAAAGNGGEEGRIAVPACVRKAVSVGATDDSDAVAPFSNRSAFLDLLAPGSGITSSAPDRTQETASGTSLAAAHVAGAFALLKERAPEADGADLLKKLQDTGKRITYRSRGEDASTPRIDLARALGLPAVTPSPTATPAPAGTPTATPAPSPAPTHTPPGGGGDLGPVPVPDVCERGKGARALSAAGWARELHKRTGTLPDRILVCYLGIVQNGSKVFPEAGDAGSPGRAYKILMGRSGKALLDRELLAAWLNHAHGVYDGSTKVHGRTTFRSAVAAAEKHRLTPKAASARVLKAAAYLNTYVNRAG
nr:S8 family serine peptidase [Planomonospora venezuelensis]